MGTSVTTKVHDHSLIGRFGIFVAKKGLLHMNLHSSRFVSRRNQCKFENELKKNVSVDPERKLTFCWRSDAITFPCIHYCAQAQLENTKGNIINDEQS